jgi:carbamoyl-phosphate synthase large subunit
MLRLKKLGFSDRSSPPPPKSRPNPRLFRSEIRRRRKERGVIPTYRLVDTCAAEFEAYTPYYYSTYGDQNERPRQRDKRKVMILGGGPNRIGQGIEFDYCCVHAAFALRSSASRPSWSTRTPRPSRPITTPATSSTSSRSRSRTCSTSATRSSPTGVIVQFGGQTPLNLAAASRPTASPSSAPRPNPSRSPRTASFSAMLDKLGLNQTAQRHRHQRGRSRRRRRESRLSRARPAQLRPRRARHADRLQRRRPAPLHAQRRRGQPGAPRPRRPLPRRRHRGRRRLHRRRRDAVIGAIMEHIEQAGVHSGDSACVIPAPTLRKVKNEIAPRDQGDGPGARTCAA